MQYQPLVAKQRESVNLSTARFNIFEGAVRSSKTVSSTLKWLRYVRKGPPGNLLMCGKTERTLKRNVIDPIVQMVGARRCRFKVGAGEVELFGRTIYVAGAHDESSADRIQGLTLAGGYGDELTTWPESFYSMLGTRMSIPGAQFFGTCNPAAKTHWLMKKFLTRARLHLDRHGTLRVNDDPEALNLHRFSFRLTDNPTLDPDFVANLHREYVGLFYRRYVEGEWVNAEGAIYDMFDEDTHVVDHLPKIVRWISVGCDYGTTNPFAAVLIGLGEDGVLYVTSEYRYDSQASRCQLTDAQYSTALRDWLASATIPHSTLTGVVPEYIVIDPSAASFRTQLRFDGITSAAGDNSVLDGLRLISTLLAAGVLKIHRSCTGLLDEMPSYAWDDKATAKGEDAPLKQDDHSVDALRYALYTTRAIWRYLIRARLDIAA